jgi:hypothetical protein
MVRRHRPIDLGSDLQHPGRVPHLPAIAGESGEPRIEVVPRFDLGPAQRGERRLMIVAIHQANWNVHAIAGHVAQLPGSVLVVEQTNK